MGGGGEGLKMRLIDLSQPVYHEGPNCPAHPKVISEVIRSHDTDNWHVELLTMAAHTGSHLDAPLHKIAGGRSIDQMPLEGFTGPAWIADLRGIEPKSFITAERLKAALPAALPHDAIVLMATGWGEMREECSERWRFEAPKLAPDAAQWLAGLPVRGLGVDHWGIGGWDPENDEIVHTILLSRGIWILEELLLTDEVIALPQPQTLMALPIHLRGHSGAWCRPVFVIEH